MAKQVKVIEHGSNAFVAFDTGTINRLISEASEKMKASAILVKDAWVQSIGHMLVYGGKELPSRCWEEHSAYNRVMGNFIRLFNKLHLPTDTMLPQENKLLGKEGGTVNKPSVFIKASDDAFEKRKQMLATMTGNEEAYFLLYGRDKENNPIENRDAERQEVYESLISFLSDLWEKSHEKERREGKEDGANKYNFVEDAEKKLARLLKTLKEEARNDHNPSVQIVKMLEKDLDIIQRMRTQQALASLKDVPAAAAEKTEKASA